MLSPRRIFNYMGKRLLAFGRDDAGQSALFAVCTMMLLVVAVAYTHNFGFTVSERVRLQNAADAAAYSGAVVEANTLSSIAWLNSCQTHIHAQMRQLMFDVVRDSTAAAHVQWGRYTMEASKARPYHRATWRNRNDNFLNQLLSALPFNMVSIFPPPLGGGKSSFEQYGRMAALDEAIEGGEPPYDEFLSAFGISNDLVERFGQDHIREVLKDMHPDNDGRINTAGEFADATIHTLLPEAEYLIGQRFGTDPGNGVRRGEMWIRQLSTVAAALAEAMPLLIRDEIVYQVRVNAPPDTHLAIYPEIIDPNNASNEWGSGGDVANMPAQRPALAASDLEAGNAFFRYEYYNSDETKNRFLTESRRQAQRMGYADIGPAPYFELDKERIYFFDEVAGKPFEKEPLRQKRSDPHVRAMEDKEAYSGSLTCWNAMDRKWQQPKTDTRYYSRKAGKEVTGIRTAFQTNYQNPEWVRGEQQGGRCDLGYVRGFTTRDWAYNSGDDLLRDDAPDGHWHSPHVHAHSDKCQKNWSAFPLCPAIMGLGLCLGDGYKSWQALVHTALLHTDGTAHDDAVKAHLHCEVARSNRSFLKSLMFGSFSRSVDTGSDNNTQPNNELPQKDYFKYTSTGAIHNSTCTRYYPQTQNTEPYNPETAKGDCDKCEGIQGSGGNIVQTKSTGLVHNDTCVHHPAYVRLRGEYVDNTYGTAADDCGFCGGIGENRKPKSDDQNQNSNNENTDNNSNDESSAEPPLTCKHPDGYTGRLYPDLIPGSKLPKICYLFCKKVTIVIPIINIKIDICLCSQTKKHQDCANAHGTTGCQQLFGTFFEIFGPFPFNTFANWPGRNWIGQKKGMQVFDERVLEMPPQGELPGWSSHKTGWTQSFPGHWWTPYDWETFLSGDYYFWDIPGYVEELFRDISARFGKGEPINLFGQEIKPEARITDGAFDYFGDRGLGSDIDFVSLLGIDDAVKKLTTDLVNKAIPGGGILSQALAPLIKPLVESITAPALNFINTSLNTIFPEKAKEIINFATFIKDEIVNSIGAIKKQFNRKGHHAIAVCPLCARACPVCPPLEFDSWARFAANTLGITRDTMHAGRDHDGDGKSDVALSYRQVLQGHDFIPLGKTFRPEDGIFANYTLGVDIDDGCVDDESKEWNDIFACDRFVRQWTSPEDSNGPNVNFCSTIVATENLFRYGITVALYAKPTPRVFNTLFRKHGQLAIATARVGFDGDGGIITGADEEQNKFTLDAIYKDFLDHPAGDNAKEGNLYYPHWGAKLVPTRYAVLANDSNTPSGNGRWRPKTDMSRQVVEKDFWRAFGKVQLFDTDGNQTRYRLREKAMGTGADVGEEIWNRYVDGMLAGEETARTLVLN